MEHQIGINLFGQFEVRLDGIPVRMPTRKVELILALLAIEPDVALSRSTLAGMLWPGQPDAQARASLRQAIFRLKTALDPSDAVEVTSGWIKLRSDRIERDIDALGRGAAASALPIGTPLEGMSGLEPEVEDRLDAARAELRARLMNWLEDAESEALAARRFADLESLARRHLVLDGYDESALRMLMTALWRQGRRNAALDAFRETSQRIRADLSVSVDPSTTALYHEIRARPAVPQDQKRTAVTAERIEPPASPTGPPAKATLPHLRHVAVMHVVSNRLLAALRNRDPEDAEAASRAASDAIERAVRREGGLIAGRAGHRLSCVFGVDRPDESPALSATFAAYEIAGLDCAVGIDAARALIGGESDSFPAAHLAQVLAEAAAPGDALCTDRVAASCSGAFSFAAADPVQTSEAKPVVAWRLTGEILSRGSFDIRKARGLTPFVARESEIDEVSALAAQVGPRAVAITGEAGIGKSRFVHETLMRLGPVQLLRVQFHPNELGGGITRFTSVLASLLGGRSADNLVAALDAAIPDATLRRRIAPVEALFAARGALPESGELPRSVRLQAIADALLLAIQFLAGRDSILLVEDAHWADDDGAMLVERMLRSLDGDGPLVIVTMRPGSGLNLSGIAGLGSITLAPLSEAESVRLLALLGHDVTSDITARSGGVPLFLEEIARLGTMPGDGSQPVPETLAGLLTRRIDALPPHLRRTIEAAAVLGAEPADDLLQPLSGLRPDAYEVAITQLADGDLLFRIRSVPQRVYGFKHALVQEAAYQAIPTNRRKELHTKVVALREDDWRAGDKGLSIMLAHHALASGQPAKAVELALCATEQAVAQSSYPLADKMLGLALKGARTLEPTAENRRLMAKILAWQRPLAWPLSKLEEVDESLAQSEAISRQLGDQHLIADICVQRAYRHTDDGQVAKALAFCDAARAAALAAGSDELVAESALARCQTFTFQGHMGRALSAIASHRNYWDDRKMHRGDLVVTRYVMLQHLLTRAHAALGESRTALDCARDMIEASQATKRPIDKYKTFLAIGEMLSGASRHDAAAEAFKSALTISREMEFRNYVYTAEAQLAELDLKIGASTDGEHTLDRLLAIKAGGLNPIPRLSAEAALLCHRLDHGGCNDLSQIKNLLERVREVDLPSVELRILDTLARCDPNGPQGWAAAAKAILAEERYAPCDLPDAEVNALMELLG
ncbi:AAA family ATPase [Rhodobacteraceae bacterium DSL-40]|uniref:AAA family ATPase n=1 Tax=Amaricoccus sp. B4 TaxID=3368557 RepID=UPI000DAD09FC